MKSYCTKSSRYEIQKCHCSHPGHMVAAVQRRRGCCRPEHGIKLSDAYGTQEEHGGRATRWKHAMPRVWLLPFGRYWLYCDESLNAGYQ